MRDYSKVSASFWTGSTGKGLRGDHAAQIVCLYLMTSPHANMIGVYHCPILYIAHETGLSIQGASKGLQRAIEGGFCTYDEASEVVFVHAFARYQILEGSIDPLKAGDKRVVAVLKAASNIPSASIRAAFVAEYASAIPGLDALKTKGLGRGIEAPSKPEAGTGAGTEAEDPPYPPTGGGEGDGDPKPKAKGLAEIAADATAAFNASPLVRANGGLLTAENPAVGQELRQKNIRRCVKLAGDIAKAMDAPLDRDWWAGYFDACHADEFWSGRKGGGRGHENWRPDFGSLTKLETMKTIYNRSSEGGSL